jgi:hypothetical protein
MCVVCYLLCEKRGNTVHFCLLLSAYKNIEKAQKKAGVTAGEESRPPAEWIALYGWSVGLSLCSSLLSRTLLHVLELTQHSQILISAFLP